MAIGVNPKPAPKPKKAYAKSHQEFIGSPSMEGGRTAKAKAALESAKNGGAVKAAKKLKPRDVVTTIEGWQLRKNRDKKWTSPRQEVKRKVVATNIINDKSKTAMRAKIIEMNKIKKAGKK